MIDVGESRGSVILDGSKRRSISAQEEKEVLKIVHGLMSCLGKLQQYPSINQVIMDAINDTRDALDKWLRSHNTMEIVDVQGNMQVNQAILSLASQQQDYMQAFLFYLTERNVRTFEFNKGLHKQEFQTFLEFFAKPAKEIVEKRNLSRTLKRMGIRHVTLSSELVMEGVIVKSKISDELQRKLSKLNINELLEKANIISQMDLNTLYKVGNLASMVTNLRYSKQEDMSNKILDRLARTLHEGDEEHRLASAKTFTQISAKAVDYTLYGLHNEVGDMMATQAAHEEDPQVFATLAQGLEKTAQVHIANGDYDQAMKVIGSLTREEVTGTLPPPTFRQVADKALRNIATPANIRKLIADLESKNEQRRAKASSLLSKVGEKAVPHLVDLIYTTEDESVLQEAVKILTHIGPPALAELYAELNEEMDDRFRMLLIRVIGSAGDVRSVVKLMPFMTHANTQVVGETVRALLRIGGPAAETKMLETLTVTTFDSTFIKERIKDFGAYRTKVMVPPLLELLNGKGLFAAHVDDEAQVLAVRALSQIGGPEVVTGLVEYLTAKKGFLGLGKGNEEVEAAACNALGHLGDSAAEKALSKCLKSKFKKVQSAASVALKRLQEGQVAQAPTVATGEPAEAAPTVFAPAAAPDAPTQAAFADEPTRMELGDDQPTQFEIDEATVPPSEPEATVAPHESFTTPSVDDLVEMTVMGEADNVPVSVVLTVGPIIVDNIHVSLPGVDDEGKLTADQQGARFMLEPGKYEVLIRDQGMEVTKVIQVEPGMSEVRLDLQDIFNF
ncbi:MAG TPA: hypothetical protein PKW95_00250 [bacterium]|nr:hypothetical protein [bacterium]